MTRLQVPDFVGGLVDGLVGAPGWVWDMVSGLLPFAAEVSGVVA